MPDRIGRVRLEGRPDGVNLFLTCGAPDCGQVDFYLGMRFGPEQDPPDPEAALWAARVLEMARYEGWLLEPFVRCPRHSLRCHEPHAPGDFCLGV